MLLYFTYDVKRAFVALQFTCPMTQKSLNLVLKTRGQNL
jgi:hypothetical protein